MYNQQFSRQDYYREEESKDQKGDSKKVDKTDINPHIPQFIAKAPWYASSTENTLEHQRASHKTIRDKTDLWYSRGTRTGPSATKFRKGACENCGAITHKTKECLDRPRKLGAKYTGKNIQPDELVEKIDLGFEAKRDRWNGYNPQEQLDAVHDWELVEEERKKLREEKSKDKIIAVESKLDQLSNLPLVVEDDANNSAVEDDGDDEKYAETAAVVGQKVDTISRTTVRNLRIREDTAKYLLNLDVHSAHYDPKTRSMRGNPNIDKDASKVVYAGDNFERWTGDATQMAKLQSFAWKAGEVGKDVHIQANPSQAELLYKEYQKRKTELSSTIKESILEKYGGEEHLKAPPKELLMAQTEHYVEYSQSGKVIKGNEPLKIRSRYPEDVFPFNHTTVWGSYWKDGVWGYACCHSSSKNAYCSGQAGIDAEKSAQLLLEVHMNDAEEVPAETLVEQHRKTLFKKFKEETLVKDSNPKRVRLGEGKISLDAIKLKQALEKEKIANTGPSNQYDITEEELEAYRMLNRRSDDPMANWKDPVSDK